MKWTYDARKWIGCNQNGFDAIKMDAEWPKWIYDAVTWI